MIHPHPDWIWREQHGKLELAGAGFRHLTQYSVRQGWSAPFNVEDVEQFWFFQQHLMNYFGDEGSIIAATLDAVAAVKQPWPACRGFWFEYLQSSPSCVGMLVQLCGQHISSGLVVSQTDLNALVLLLHPITTLQGKSIDHGQVVQVPFNRLRPLHIGQQAYDSAFPRSA